MFFLSLLLICVFELLNPQAIAADFGSYSLYQGNYQNNNVNYRAYVLNQTLANQKRRANMVRQRNAYYNNPTRNIRYPNPYNQYPNIQRNNYRGYANSRNYATYGSYRL